MKQEKKWALISVYNKDGIVEFAQKLVTLGWSIMSSGGTAKKLQEAGVPVIDVAEFIGGNAILGHKVVTLSRELHAGLLAHLMQDAAEMSELGLDFINMVVCDFYPLKRAINNPPEDVKSHNMLTEYVISQTDIGGPTMVSSGAKGGRIVITDASDRKVVLHEIETTGSVSYMTVQTLRAKAHAVVANYRLQSAIFHGQTTVDSNGLYVKREGPGTYAGIIGRLLTTPRYGENADQSPAGLYITPGKDDPFSMDKFHVIKGTDPSFNNFCDIDRLMQTMSHIAAAHFVNFGIVYPIAIGVKHGNPCGAAVGEEAIRRMITGDGRAIFGGLVMCNFNITSEMAEALLTEGVTGDKNRVLDGIIAPSISDEAINVLQRKNGKCRIITNPALANDELMASSINTEPLFRKVRGGFLVQPNYEFVLNFDDPDMVITGEFNRQQKEGLLLAWAVGCTSNSNTVTIVKDDMLIGNGTGQQDRVGAAELALKRARDAGHTRMLNGAVAYSDSFFPFPDAVEVLIRAGIKTIFSTTGSVKDREIQQLCVQNGVTLYQLSDTKARGFFGH